MSNILEQIHDICKSNTKCETCSYFSFGIGRPSLCFLDKNPENWNVKHLTDILERVKHEKEKEQK